jgi:ribosomal protein S27E
MSNNSTPPVPPRHPRPGLAAGRAAVAGQLSDRSGDPARTDPRRSAGARSGRHRHRIGRTEGRPQPLPEMRRHRHPPAPGTDLLICLFCRNEWHGAAGRGGIRLRRRPGPALEGTIIASGARDIAADAASLMSFKCTGCGAEVTVNTENAMTARCHWCRHVLRRQRAGGQRRGARCGAALPHQEGRRSRAHPPVRGQAATVRAEGIQGTVHARRT